MQQNSTYINLQEHLPIMIHGLNEIVSRYDAFIFDKCGVLDDQKKPFKEALEAVHTLRQQGKTVIIMGNSPVTRSTMVEDLNKVGLSIDPAFVWTSGEIFLRELQSKKVPGWSSINAARIFYCGKEHLWDAIMEIAPDTIRVDAVETAHLMIIAQAANVTDGPDCMDDLLYKALRWNIPMLCLNPDKTAMLGYEHDFYTPGMWAKRYQDIGGTVIKFYGKPYTDIYEYVLHDLNNRGFYNRERILMVGDTLYTDVQGAHNAGIHSLWILHGSHRNKVLNNNGHANYEAITSIMHDYKLLPDWFATGLRW